MNNFLLTYRESDSLKYAWFENKEDMDHFVEEYHDIEITEALEIVAVNEFTYRA